MFETLDIIIIFILAFAFLYGLYKGIISITVPIIAIAATFIIAPLIYNYASKYFNHSIILKIISFIITYSAVRIILSKVEENIKKLLKIIFLSGVDRLLGAVILTFLACIIISLISYIATLLISEYPNMFSKYSDMISKSKILSLIRNIFNTSGYIDKIFNINKS